MKSVTSLSQKISLFTAALLIISGSHLFASIGGEKVVEKARASVEKAAPDDWKTLAEAAQLCIKKKVNMKEASEWIHKSIDIKKTQFNTEVMGDYYRVNNLPEKAVAWYMESMALGKKSTDGFDASMLQAKMFDLRKQ